MRSKYHSRKITRDGITFDSVKEYKRWCELSLLERAGKITGLQRQVKFTLIPAQYEVAERYSQKTGKRLKDKQVLLEKECAYIADHVYTTASGKQVVEDVKGVRTPDYIIKRKLMLWLHGIRIHEV